REYNIFQLQKPNFNSLKNALYQEEGQIIANYGLDPKLGKYHRNFCEKCRTTLISIHSAVCSQCGSSHFIKGVYDRLLEIGDMSAKSPPNRPPYHYQIPLSFLPGVGPKTIDKLINNFGSEMQVVHKVHFSDLEKVVGPKIAELIDLARKGQLQITPGGGGIYGKVSGA
ncbi:MAG: TIGR00375 family protein, partial [Peptococcales bacterium]